MKHWIVGLFCAALSWAAWAAEPDQVRKTAEASMLVTGWIEVMPDGSVHTYSMDRPEKIPPFVVDLIQKSVPQWKFKVDNNITVIRRARMNLRIVAKPIGDDRYAINIEGTSFGNSENAPGEYISYKARRPIPTYPRSALEAHVDGTVYLLLRIGRQGQVEDAIAEQVNLGEYGSESDMREYRQELANAALKAASKWTYNTPTSGKHVADPYWNVRVPVNFSLKVPSAHEEDMYGKWQGYIPGPRQPIPWEQKAPQVSVAVDAISEGSISQADQDLQLITPLQGA